MDAPEQLAQKTIDAQLGAAVWFVQSIAELNLAVARGLVVREMQSQGGLAHYLLFVDGRAIGIDEAEKEGTTFAPVAEQYARYTAAHKWIPQRWADPRPITHESTGISILRDKLFTEILTERLGLREGDKVCLAA